MADFARAFARLRELEGGFSDDPHDYGGKTYAGITKRWYPSWRGWALLAEYQADATPELEHALDDAVEEFYETTYWTPLRGSRVPSQAVAEELLEAAVHTTVKTAVEWLQTSLNVWNNNGKRWADIVVDGDLGPATLAALAAAMKLGREHDIVRGQNVQQAAYYWQRFLADPTQERFTGGWLARAQA